MFELHPQLRSDCRVVGSFSLTLLLLLDDARYPWFLLVPQRADIGEIYQLSSSDRTQLWIESDQLSRTMVELFRPDKLNIAALGNVVPQLHVHHIARYKNDEAWPRPVWGQGSSTAYAAAAREQIIERVGQRLVGVCGFKARD